METTPATAPDVQLTSTVTCPSCGVATEAMMPAGECQFFWDCPACQKVVRPKPGDCCVFCSYGDVPCPSIQRAGAEGDAATCCS